MVLRHNIFINNYLNRIKENIKNVKKLPKIKGVKEIFYPGQRKFKKYKINLNKDILISNKIKNELFELLND